MNLRSTWHQGVWLMLATLSITPAAAQEQSVAWRIELDAPGDVRTILENHLDIYRYSGRPGVDAAMLQRLVALGARCRIPARHRGLFFTES
ncbi:MAG: hypothetical protein RLZZ445_2630 [Pseudomonadota bacterium]|jgi:hypothetical protein